MATSDTMTFASATKAPAQTTTSIPHRLFETKVILTDGHLAMDSVDYYIICQGITMLLRSPFGCLSESSTSLGCLLSLPKFLWHFMVDCQHTRLYGCGLSNVSKSNQHVLRMAHFGGLINANMNERQPIRSINIVVVGSNPR
jgi:hypothetical protein